ncbi:MAG: bifunctional homocysteine S-methyltransferase/methylenetetrahydrofolate reductase, partial [Gammaproteobacteria bacterium]|nr:bifunctional homocysteine S-methyltransferase/methylenetetrahydrofolate reductase [Gammaproteobacteria bacterium]
VFAAVSEPASLGDYPTTRQLSDLGTDGLVRVMEGMNRGLDLAGNPIGEPTAFVPFVGGDPQAADQGAEVARVEAALESGAVAVITPPQFGPDPLRVFCEAL